LTWAKTSDDWWRHKKTLGLSLAARGLWSAAQSWSMDQLTDGLIPQSAVKLLGGSSALAQQLVTAGLWDAEADGYRFHDWLECNPSVEEILKERAKGNQRAARSYERRRAMSSAESSPEEQPKTPRSFGVSSPAPIPIPIPSPIPTSQQRPECEWGAVAPPRRQRAKPSVPKDPQGEQIARAATWDAYRVSYCDRYGEEPLDNAKVRGQIKHFVQRVPRDEAPLIVAAYLRSNNARYVAAGHAFGPLLQDAEAVRTEAVTGKSRTQWGARDADKRDGRRQDYEELFADLRKRDEAKEAERRLQA
jgi:hypothetical protein